VHKESTASAFVAPGLAALLLAGVLLISLTHLDSLLGVRPGHPLTVIVPIAIVAIVGLGALWGNFLRTNRPAVFELIGQGADSARARVNMVNR
jgi:hypothetical protein